MVYDQPDNLHIVQQKTGRGTGERLYRTADGRWWRDWDGTVRTGQEVRIKKNNHLE